MASNLHITRCVLLDTKYLVYSKISIFVEWNVGTRRRSILNTHTEFEKNGFSDEHYVRIADIRNFQFNFEVITTFSYISFLTRLAKKR